MLPLVSRTCKDRPTEFRRPKVARRPRAASDPAALRKNVQIFLDSFRFWGITTSLVSVGIYPRVDAILPWGGGLAPFTC